MTAPGTVIFLEKDNFTHPFCGMKIVCFETNDVRNSSRKKIQGQQPEKAAGNYGEIKIFMLSVFGQEMKND